jgi:hypothetical protein
VFSYCAQQPPTAWLPYLLAGQAARRPAVGQASFPSFTWPKGAQCALWRTDAPSPPGCLLRAGVPGGCLSLRRLSQPIIAQR